MINAMRLILSQVVPSQRHRVYSLSSLDVLKALAPVAAHADADVGQFPLRLWFQRSNAARSTKPLPRSEPVLFIERPTSTVLLFYGPSGCGKTLMAEATFGEMGRPRAKLSAHDLTKDSRGLDLLRGAIQQGRRGEIGGVLIEDIDEAFLAWREKPRLYSDILAEFGVPGCALVATTQRPERLTKAERDAFAEMIPILYPDAEQRLDILQRLASRAGLDRDIDLASLVKATNLWSGAELKQLVTLAASAAVETRVDLSRLVRAVARTAKISIDDREKRMRYLVRWTVRHCTNRELRANVKRRWFQLMQPQRPRGRGKRTSPRVTPEDE